MNKHLLILAIAIAGCLIIESMMNRVIQLEPAHAQQETTLSESTKWEYCAITGTIVQTGVGGRGSSYASVTYFEEVGGRYEKIDGGRNNQPLATAIAKLGAEGWEMIGPGSALKLDAEHPDALFFKRQRR